MTQRDNARDRKTYTIKTLLDTLGISRNALRYYEQIGIVSPARDPGSNYRIYTNRDVFRVVQINIMKNCGYEVQDAQAELDAAHDSETLARRVASEAKRKAAWLCAARDQLDLLRKTVEEVEEAKRDVPAPRLELSESYLLYFDECEEGYDNATPDTADGALINSMPVSSFGSLIAAGALAEDTIARGPVESKWCRVVPERLASLIPELKISGRKPMRVGGVPCVRISYSVAASSIPGFDSDGAVRRALAKFMKDSALEQSGEAFATDSEPILDTFYAVLHVPVRGTTWRSRRRLAQLAR